MTTAKRMDDGSDLRINGVSVANVSMDEALGLIDDSVSRRQRRCFFFVNAHCINVTDSDEAYRRILQREDATVFGDGIGMRIAGRLGRQPLRDNVNGTDMFPLLCARAAKNGRRLFLLGAQPGVAAEAARRMTARYPGLSIAGARDGFFGEAETEDLLAEINASGADVLLVAMGVPRQEHWLAQQRCRLSPPAALAVGGLFDYYSGRIPRAPLFVRRIALEWAWRLAMEPRRMWRRYLVGNIAFLWRILRWSLDGRIGPG